MFKEWINAYKIISYGLAIKRQMAFAIAFLLIGIALDAVTKGAQPTGGFYIVLSGMFIYQLIISSDVSTLIQSSPYKKKIQCTYPLLATVPWIFIAFTIVAVMHWFFAKNGDTEQIAEQGRIILTIGAFVFICLIYFGLVYKYFLISTICMVFTISPCTLIFMGVIRKHYSLFENYWLCVAIVYGLLIVGTVISWYLSKLVYKKDMSKAAFKMMMKKG